MTLFGEKKERNFSTIVAPLKQMETDLADYIGEQQTNQAKLEEAKAEIDAKISKSKTEQAQSEHTILKIADFIGSTIPEVTE